MRRSTTNLRLIEKPIATSDELAGPAGRITEQFYHAILSLGEVMLVDSSIAKIEAYYPPRLDGQGRYHCGLDVRLADGSLFEFTLKNTGWEKPSAPNASQLRLRDKFSAGKLLRSLLIWVK
jgi:hypothetical protein